MKYTKGIALFVGCCFFLAIFSACGGGSGGDDGVSDNSTSWSVDQIKNQIRISNLNNPFYKDNAGRISRWNVPIPVNTHGIARADEALARYNALTHGYVSFVYVDGTPKNGIEFVEGCGVNADGTPGPGSTHFNIGTNNGALRGTYKICLGSPGNDDATTGNFPSAIAEHELGHALGLHDHFDGFTGDEGLSPNLLAVIYNIYTNPIGATFDELVITYP